MLTRIRQLFRRRRRNRIDERRSVAVADIVADDAKDKSRFCDNTVTSSKYNIFTFLPLNLFDQLHRPIMVYFVLISALQFIPSVAPVNPYTTLFPLTIALLANTIKEGFDDLRRHRQDRENNRRMHRIVDPRTRRIKEVLSKDIHVGDVVVLGPAETVPCDVVVLFTSGTYGEALISTASIDGETGTKEKHALLNNFLKRPSSSERDATHTRTDTRDTTTATAAATAATDPERGAANRDGRGRSSLGACGPADVEAAMSFLEQSQLVLDSEGPNPFLHVFTGSVHYTTPLPSSSQHHYSEQHPPPPPQPYPPRQAVSGPGGVGVRFRLASGGSSNSAFGDMDETSRLLEAGAPPVARGHFRTPADAVVGPLTPFTGETKIQAVTPDNLILSSSRVENTRMILGMAVFTGMESKLNMTRNTPMIKVASIDRSLNLLAIPIFALEFTLVVIYSILSCVHLANAPTSAWYLGLTRTHRVPSNEYFPVLPLRFFTMLSPMVPMSFKTMIELSKAYVSAVVRWDDALKHNGKPVMVNNSALAEELGKVEYVLSDKTGTLTQNQMRFRCLVTATNPPTLYEQPNGLDSDQPTQSDDAGAALDGDGDTEDGSPRPFVRGTSTRGVPYDAGSPTQFLVLAMAFCNTIEPAMASASSVWSGDAEETAEPGVAAPVSRWLSVSPDEIALVDGAESLGGLRLLSRSRQSARAEYVFRTAAAHVAPPMFVRATICKVLPFTSERGRMSILLRLHSPPAPPNASSSGLSPPTHCQVPDESEADDKDGLADEYVLLMKGSDERVLPLCNDAFRDGQHAQILATLKRLASCGLRTLVYGYRLVPAAQAKRWLDTFDTATAQCATTEARQACTRRLYAELEGDLQYCGCTAVEDLLQEALPETISQLRNAGIRTWVLTGDRSETARQTAIASGLLRPNDKLVSLLAESATARQTAADHFAHVKYQIDRVWQELDRLRLTTPVSGGASSSFGQRWTRRWQQWYASSGLRDVVHEFTNRRAVDGDGTALKPLNSQMRVVPTYRDIPFVRHLTTPASHNYSATETAGSASPVTLDYSVLLSGGVTKMIFASSDAELRRRFRLILLHARTVICSRTAPDQKALFVDMVRASGKVTLAIGDGGNDVAMIQSAHVGVGITGREGNQAALAADFAIGEFQLLARLLLVHGHMAYERSAMIIQQSFWKTVLIAWVQILFNHWTDFSGISYWDSYSLMLYNAIPTVPVTFLCVMDVPLSPLLLLQNPQLYAMSQHNRYLSVTTFYGYVLRAILHGSAVFLLSMGLQRSGGGGILREGWELDRQGDFYAAYFAVVTIHTFTVCIESHSITAAHWQCFLFSVWSCFLCFGLAAAAPGTNQTFSVLLRNPSFYLHYIVITAVVCLSLSLYATVKVFWFPDLLQLQRLAMRTVCQKSFRRTWGAQQQRLLRLLWHDDNPSTFWWSLVPSGRCQTSEAAMIWDEEVATRGETDDDIAPRDNGDTPL